VRVKDPRTGHEFDRREDDPAVISGRFERVKPKLYPPSPRPRPAKHKPAGLSASRETPPQSGVAEATNPDKE
jgi:hypothetical protein